MGHSLFNVAIYTEAVDTLISNQNSIDSKRTK